jgi:ABC-type bacteriocin/lantibiotic exporter with double-glycine peptidase domain
VLLVGAISLPHLSHLGNATRRMNQMRNIRRILGVPVLIREISMMPIMTAMLLLLVLELSYRVLTIAILFLVRCSGAVIAFLFLPLILLGII